jgi:hypothetical protein
MNYVLGRNHFEDLSSCDSPFNLKVEAERAYHQTVLQILDQLEGEVRYPALKSFYPTQPELG